MQGRPARWNFVGGKIKNVQQARNCQLRIGDALRTTELGRYDWKRLDPPCARRSRSGSCRCSARFATSGTASTDLETAWTNGFVRVNKGMATL